MLNTTIIFETGRDNGYGKKGTWTLIKEFNDERHMDNFINYITRTKGYYLDELYIHNR